MESSCSRSMRGVPSGRGGHAWRDAVPSPFTGAGAHSLNGNDPHGARGDAVPTPAGGEVEPPDAAARARAGSGAVVVDRHQDPRLADRTALKPGGARSTQAAPCSTIIREETEAMKVGLFLNTQFPEGDDIAARLSQMVEQVRLARHSGFASLWFPDHYIIGPVQMPQPMPLMAWLLREAEGMVVGPNIRILPLLSPVMVAEEAATMDLLSGGRYVLGVGLGYRQAEFTAFGVPIQERAARLGESIGLIRKLWTEKSVTHRGRHYTVEDASLSLHPATPGGPPIYVAAMVDAAVRRAARLGDAWLIVNSADIATVKSQMAVYRAALAETGRTAREYPITRECYIGTSHATAFEECRAALHYKYAAYASWGLTRQASDLEMFGMPFEQFVRDRFIIGDKVSVKEEIARYRAELGVDHFIMRVQWPGLPQERVLHSIRCLGEIFG